MKRKGRIVTATGALLFFSLASAAAQDPVRVLVVGELHHQWEPITVLVSNESKETVTLSFPLFMTKRGEASRSRLPLEVEKRTDSRWMSALPPPQPLEDPRVPTKLGSGQSVEFRLGVVGTGEYRIRVWYVVEPGDPRPPTRRRPKHASVVSPTFVVSSGK